MRTVVFVLGALPQTSKLFAMTGTPGKENLRIYCTSLLLQRSKPLCYDYQNTMPLQQRPMTSLKISTKTPIPS